VFVIIDCRALTLDITLCCTLQSLQSLQLQILFVRSIYSCCTDTPIVILLETTNRPNLTDEKRWRALGAKPVIKFSEINYRRCRFVLSVDFGSAVCQFWSVNCSFFDAGVCAIMWGFILLFGLLRKHLFIYKFIYYSPRRPTQFPRAEILNYRNYIRNGYDAGSNIANASARHAALKRWTVTDNRLNKNVVSRGSVVTSVKRLAICAKNSWVLTLMGPSVSSATRKKSWVPLSELYLFLFLTALVSAVLALVMALCCR